MNILRTLPLTLLASGLGLGVAHAASASTGDRAFVAMVSQGGLFESKAGALAASQGNTEDIKDQGTTEEHDHELVNGKLAALAKADGIPVEGKLNATFERQLDEMRSLSGPAFDAAYLHAMADIHAKDGAAFTREAKEGSDPKLKSFAAQTHRIVVRHVGEISAIGPAAS